MTRFKHPQASGVIHRGDESYEIRDGVVECPDDLGEAAGWPRSFAHVAPVQAPAPESGADATVDVDPEAPLASAPGDPSDATEDSGQVNGESIADATPATATAAAKGKHGKR